MKNTGNKPGSKTLRQKAEELVNARKDKACLVSTAEIENLELIHEQEVHQCELEMLNEELLAKEQIAKDAADKYAELYDSAPLGYFTLSNEGTIIEVNISGATMLGKDRPQLKSNRFAFFVSEGTRTVFNLFLERVFSSRANESCDVILESIGKLPLHVHLIGIVTKNCEQCLLTVVDINESRIMVELHQSEQRYQALVEWSPYAALVHRDMKIVYVNPAAVKLFGATSEKELVGTPVMRWHHPDFHEIVRERIRKANEEGIAGPMIESKYFKLDGTVMDLEVQGKPIIYNGFPSILATFNDVTDRKKAEQVLMESEKKYRMLLEGNIFGILAFDFETHRCSFSNTSACKLFGYDEEEIIRLNLPDFHPKDSVEMVIDEFKSQARGEKSISNDLPCLRKDGTIFYADIAGYATVLNGRDCSIGFIIDVTDRMKAEQKLRTAEENYRVLLNGSSNGILAIDIETHQFLFSNPTICKLFGYTDIEFQRLGIENLVPKESLGIVLSEFASHIREEKPTSFAIPCQRKDGTIFYSDISSAPVPLGGRKCSVGFFIDVTERVQAENKLRESEKRFSQVVEQSQEVVWEVDSNGLYTYVSPMAQAIYGYLPEQMINKIYFYDLHPEAAREKFKKNIFNMFHRKMSFYKLVNSIVKPDGTTHILNTTGIPVLDEKGNLAGYRGVDNDITEHKQMEKDLQDSEKRFRMLAENSTDMISCHTLDGAYTYASPACKSLLGYGPEELIGHSCYEFINSNDIANIEQSCKMVVEEQKHDVVTYRLRRKEGRYIWIESIIHSIKDKDSGAAIEIQVSSRDITERKQAAENILQLNIDLDLRVKLRTSELEAVNKELEAANKELETFSYSVSHDLKAPLRYITGVIGIFLENKPSGLSEKDLGYLDIISSSALEMGKLIDGILIFSKLNAIEIQKTVIRSSEMVMQVIQFFETDIQNRKITFQVETLPEVKGDENLIRQVWTNLISNAIKYTMKKQEAIIEIGSFSTDSELTFFIKDNGAGFNMKYAEKLFKVFQRLHKPRDFEGVGIGLANVNRIVARHGGHCRAEGEVDKGAKFYFSLPK